MLEPRAGSGVSSTAFYAFAAGIGGAALLVGAFFLMRWRRKRAARRRAFENQARQRHLQHTSPPSSGSPQGQGQPSQSLEPIPPAYSPTHRGRVKERLPPPRDRLPRRNASGPRPDTNVLRAQLDALGTSSGVAPSQPESNRLAPPPNVFNPDEGSAQSDASEFDMERRGAAVNPAWAAQRQARDREMAAMGYTESDMMLASDQTDDADDGTPERADNQGWVGQPVHGGRPIEGIDGMRMQTLSERAAWALPDSPRQANPSAAGIQKPLPTQSTRIPRLPAADTRSPPREQTSPRHQVPIPTVQIQRAPLDVSPQQQARTRPRANIARQLYPEYDISGAADSVDSSHLSHADLAPSTAETEQEEEDARLSRDPWFHEVQVNRRAAARGRGSGRGR